MTSSDNIIGARLALFRKNVGLKQSEFAKLLGKGQSAISHIESGKNSLEIELLRVLADKLDLNPSWIILNQGEMFLSKNIESELTVHNESLERENGLLNKYVASLEELIKNKDTLIEKLQRLQATENIMEQKPK